MYSLERIRERDNKPLSYGANDEQVQTMFDLDAS